MLQLFVVPATHIDQAWQDGAHMLAKACQRSGGEVTGEQLKMSLAYHNTSMLVCAVDAIDVKGWAVVQFQQLPNKRVLFVEAIYAPGIIGAEVFGLLSKFAADGGALVIRAAANGGAKKLWQKKYKAAEIYSVLEMKCNLNPEVL